MTVTFEQLQFLTALTPEGVDQLIDALTDRALVRRDGADRKTLRAKIAGRVEKRVKSARILQDEWDQQDPE